MMERSFGAAWCDACCLPSQAEPFPTNICVGDPSAGLVDRKQLANFGRDCHVYQRLPNEMMASHHFLMRTPSFVHTI